MTVLVSKIRSLYRSLITKKKKYLRNVLGVLSLLIRKNVTVHALDDSTQATKVGHAQVSGRSSVQQRRARLGSMGKLLECEIPVCSDGAQLFESAHHVGKAFVGGDAEALAVEISKESLRTDSTRTGGLERVKELASGRCDEVLVVWGGAGH